MDPRPPWCPLSWPLSVQRAAFSSLLLSRAARQHPSRAQAPQANRQPAHSREIQLQLPSRRPNLRQGAEAERASWRTMWVRVGAALREGAHRGQPHLPHSSPLFDPLVQPSCSHLGPGVCAQGAGHWSLQCSGGRMGDSAWTKQVGQLHGMLEGSVWCPGGLEHVAVLDREDKMTFEQSAEGDQVASHIGMWRGSVSR